MAIGYGGDALVSSAAGLARETIRKGRQEMARGDDTPAFAAASLLHWRERMGRSAYPDAIDLLHHGRRWRKLQPRFQQQGRRGIYTHDDSSAWGDDPRT